MVASFGAAECCTHAQVTYNALALDAVARRREALGIIRFVLRSRGRGRVGRHAHVRLARSTGSHSCVWRDSQGTLQIQQKSKTARISMAGARAA